MGHCADTWHTGDTIRVNVGSGVGHNGGEQGEKTWGGGGQTYGSAIRRSVSLRILFGKPAMVEYGMNIVMKE